MCLIIYNKGGEAKTPENYLKAAYENNHDGFGMMFADNGKVHVIRGLFDYNEIKQMIDDISGYPHVVHFRYRTRGPIDVSNCHPHRVLSKKSDGQDLWMMHNGTFFHLKADEEESDSVKFAKHLRSALRVYGPDTLFDKSQLHRMANRVGSVNKLVFLRGDGKIALVNKNQGFEEDGCWYSNTYSLKSGYREAKAAVDSANVQKYIQLNNKLAEATLPKKSSLPNLDSLEDCKVSLLTPKNQKKDSSGKKKKNKNNDRFKLEKKTIEGTNRKLVYFRDNNFVVTDELN